MRDYIKVDCLQKDTVGSKPGFVGFHAGFWSGTETTEIVGKRIVAKPRMPQNRAGLHDFVDFVDLVGHMEVHRPLSGDPLQDGSSLAGVNVPRLVLRNPPRKSRIRY